MSDATGLFVARAELVLARDDRMPLRAVPLDPDPLTGLARAMGAARDDLAERVEVVVDLLPLTGADRRRRRRTALAEDAERTGARDQLAHELFGPGGLTRLGEVVTGRQSAGPRGPASPGRLADEQRRRETTAVGAKVLGVEPAFWLQLLIRCESTVPGRDAALLQACVAAFESWSGENHFRQVGHRVGPWYIGSDSWLYRRRFDRRWVSGRHRAARRQMVTVAEIGGLLKPPTRRCAAANVARSGGITPAAPRGLPTYTGQPDLLPLGWVRTDTGERPVGVRLDESLLLYDAGRATYGKTHAAVARAAAVFRAGHGGLYLDPHGEAVADLKEMLDERDDVVAIDLADPTAPRQAGWNVFSMEGYGSRDVEPRVAAVVDSFAAALGWDESSAPRALTLTTMASQALCELALRLPPHLAPTIFSLPTLLTDEGWRSAVLPYLGRHTRDFFARKLGRLDAEAVAPVTNLVDRMRSIPPVAALLGSSRSTYDVRRSMDQGGVVLWSLDGTGAWVDLVAGLVTHDLFRAAAGRRTLPADQRRPFYAWIDELHRVAGNGPGPAADGAARSIEEAHRVDLRLQLTSPQPARLPGPVLDAILTQRSHLLSHTVDADSAGLLAAEWGGDVTPTTITRLERFWFLAQVTLDGSVTRPFPVRGFDVDTDEPWVGWRRPDRVARVDERVDRALARRPVRDVLDDLDMLDDRIVEHIEDGLTAQPADGPRPRPRPAGAEPALRPARGRRAGHLVVLDDGDDLPD